MSVRYFSYSFSTKNTAEAPFFVNLQKSEDDCKFHVCPYKDKKAMDLFFVLFPWAEAAFSWKRSIDLF